MKLNFGLLRRRWHMAVLLAAGFLPLPLVLCAKRAPDALWAGLPAAGLYVLFSWLCTVLPGRRRLIAAVLGAAAIAVVELKLLPWMGALMLLLIPLVYGYLLFAGLAYGGEETPLVYPCVAAGVHIVAQFIQLFDANANVQMPTAVIYALRLAFVVFGFLVLFSLNRISLREAAAKGSPAPLTVKRRNLLLTVALGGLTMLIACLPAVLRFFQRFWDAFVVLVKKIWAILCALLAAEEAPMSGGMGGLPDGMLAGEVRETSLFWKILEKIAMVVGLIAAAALVVVILVILWRKFRKLFALVAARLREYAQAASEDYHDEISDTREGGERTSIFRRFVRRRDPLKGIDEAKLPPRERIRFYYLRAWLKRSDWEVGHTARENLPSEAAGIYEKARYSQHDVTEAEAAEFGRKVGGK